MEALIPRRLSHSGPHLRETCMPCFGNQDFSYTSPSELFSRDVWLDPFSKAPDFIPPMNSPVTITFPQKSGKVGRSRKNGVPDRCGCAPWRHAVTNFSSFWEVGTMIK